MPLDTIYLTRHGHRLNWTIDLKTGIYHSNYPTPTGIPVDPTLTLPGIRQSHELASHLSSSEFSPKPCRVYCSPFYRCLQTIQPSVEALKELQKKDAKQDDVDLNVRIENGFGEWFGRASFTHPGPAPLDVLQPLFPTILPQTGLAYKAQIFPSPHGETIAQLHDRVATALDVVIEHVDAEIAAYERDHPEARDQSRAIIICSHAAPLIAMGRALTGHMPEDPTTEDFNVFTAGLSTFKRRKHLSGEDKSVLVSGDASGTLSARKIPDWRGGRGIRGGWDCIKNGDCSFLSGGAERGWHFTGEEDFNSMPEPPTLNTTNIQNAHGNVQPEPTSPAKL
ncbi:hypothetical protein VTO42DRAFT_3373 [Malbranchea cinnamomea]